MADIPIIGQTKPRRRRLPWQEKFIEGTIVHCQGQAFKVFKVFKDAVLLTLEGPTGQEKKRSGKVE